MVEGLVFRIQSSGFRSADLRLTSPISELGCSSFRLGLVEVMKLGEVRQPKL